MGLSNCVLLGYGHKGKQPNQYRSNNDNEIYPQAWGVWDVTVEDNPHNQYEDS